MKYEKKGAYTAQELAKCAIFVVIMTVAAYVQIPFWPVPLSFQTVICVLAGLLLGAKYGGLSMLCYLLLGIAGVPVFTKGGGFWYVTELTFGYIAGFVAGAITAGIIAPAHTFASYRKMIFASLAAMLVDYFFGSVWFCLMWRFYLNASGVWAALWSYNIIYMFKDVVLCILAAFLARKLLPLVVRGYNTDHIRE